MDIQKMELQRHVMLAIMLCGLILCTDGLSTGLMKSQKIFQPQRNAVGGKISIDIASIPGDLDGIRECRSTVDFANQANLLASQRSFLNATALSNSGFNAICVIAREKKGKVLGTTDCRIAKKEVVVNNVFVRADQRGKGIGEKMMLDGVEKLVMTKPSVTAKKCSLNVYTNNKAAVRLYQKCGYELSDPLNAFVFWISRITGASLQVAMSKTIR
mmetsp:Transcript_9446/g.16928  ORF Transcript_9446/g.16928 Transcript_9446/m.16928 type:complete len:215 (-) Transcript_9446:168-812(-)